MQLKNRINKIYNRMKRHSAEDNEQPPVTVEQWKRWSNGEDITAEIPIHRRAAFDEWQRVVNERRQQAEATYLLFNEEI